MFAPSDLFDLQQTSHRSVFEGCSFGWEVLPRLARYIHLLTASSPPPSPAKCCFIGREVIIGEGTKIEEGVMIKGPAIIGKNCEIRHNAYVRENVIIGDGCTIGNSSEIKNALLFNEVAVPHFNYVGDSVLGYKAHLGAGVILSNVKSMPGNITVRAGGKTMDTGLRKFGALLGDHAEIGCNSVLNPGSIIGRRSVVYATCNWRGCLPDDHIAKWKGHLDVVPRR